MYITDHQHTYAHTKMYMCTHTRAAHAHVDTYTCTYTNKLVLYTKHIAHDLKGMHLV